MKQLFESSKEGHWIMIIVNDKFRFVCACYKCICMYVVVNLHKIEYISTGDVAARGIQKYVSVITEIFAMM